MKTSFRLWAIFLVIFVSFASCGSCGSSSLTNTIEDLAEQDLPAVEGGPVSIPVTVAKFDGADLNFLQVTVVNDTSIMVTGRAGANHDPSTTPFMALCDINQDTSTTSGFAAACSFVSAASDGSFAATTISSHRVAIFTANKNDITDPEARLSAPLVLIIDDQGNVRFTLTNVGGRYTIRNNVSVVRDSDDNFYWAVEDSDTGDSQIYARDSDGSPPYLVTTHTEVISYLAILDSGTLVFLDETAGLYYAAVTSVDDDGIPTYADNVLVETFSLVGTAAGDNLPGEEADNAGAFSWSSKRFIFFTEGDFLLVQGRENTFDAFFIKAWDFSLVPASAPTAQIIQERDTGGESAALDLAREGSTFYVNIGSTSSTTISQFDLSSVTSLSELSTAYDNRSEYLSTGVGCRLITVGSETESCVTETVSGSTVTNNFRIFADSTSVFLSDSAGIYDSFSRLAPGGEFVFVCRTADGTSAIGGSGGESADKILQAYIVGDSSNTLTTVLQGSAVCNGAKRPLLFGANNQFFSFSGGDGTEDPQVFVIKLNETSALADVLE